MYDEALRTPIQQKRENGRRSFLTKSPLKKYADSGGQLLVLMEIGTQFKVSAKRR